MQELLSPLTRDGHRVLTNARRISKQYNQPIIDSDVLLLGLLQLSGSQAEGVLRSLHIKLESLIARLEASIKLESRQNQIEMEGLSFGKYNLSQDSTTIFNEALSEAQQHGLDFIDPRLLILGMLRCPYSKAGQVLDQYGVELEQFRASSSFEKTPVTNVSRFKIPEISLMDRLYFGVSPIFIGLVIFTFVSGYLTYVGIGNSQAFMLFFVMGGWVISVALHEFGHALIAYLGGDDSVVDKGYLTLNPLKYSHPFLSIFMPVVFLLMGGIGFPGGAVYIHPHAIRSDTMRSLTSAAGPIATALCATIISLPFVFEVYTYEMVMAHFEFWAGLALLGFLQITAIFINMLPIPGLDGFGIAQPFLSPEISEKINLIRPFGFFILYGLLFMDTPVRDLFWEQVWDIAIWISPDFASLAYEGFQLFHFWG